MFVAMGAFSLMLITRNITLSTTKIIPQILSERTSVECLSQNVPQEKDKIFEKDTLDQSLEGKDPLVKARIVSEHNRRKMKKSK